MWLDVQLSFLETQKLPTVTLWAKDSEKQGMGQEEDLFFTVKLYTFYSFTTSMSCYPYEK